jgi:hypothetical protein
LSGTVRFLAGLSRGGRQEQQIARVEASRVLLAALPEGLDQRLVELPRL